MLEIPPAAEQVSRTLADRAKALRLAKAWTRRTLANRAGVSLASLKRFETTGLASLGLVLRVAAALGRLHEFERLLAPVQARSIEELEATVEHPTRRRGRL